MPALLNLDGSTTVKTAAEFIGISPSILRNRYRAGKLELHRNPMKRYGLFRRTALEAALRCAARRERENV